MKITLTEKERIVLMFIKGEQNELGHSEFTSDYIKTKSVAGVVSSLEKKGMIYDSYANYEDNLKMWCLSDEGAEKVGIPLGWL